MERLLLASIVLFLAARAVSAQDEAVLTKFDCHDLELRHDGDRWQLRGGTAFVKDLGTSENDAREAQRIIRELRLTQHGSIGSPQPVIEYWLADGQPPQGFPARYRLSSFDLKSLQVVQMEGHWCLRDARQLLFNFGPREQDAQQALAMLKRYQFNRVGYVGAANPVMMYFMAGADDNHPSDQRLQRPITMDQLRQPRQLSAPSPLVYDPATGSEHLPLDWRQVQVRHEGQRVKLVFGNQCLADFGGNEMDAREALRIVQYYRFTEQCRVGASNDAVTFYLVNGQAPHGLGAGVRSTGFHPGQLTVRQIDDHWMLCENDRPVLRAGKNATEAKQVLTLIQKYKFDNLCYIGRADAPALTFLVQGR
jgi:hypothetical protein